MNSTSTGEKPTIAMPMTPVRSCSSWERAVAVTPSHASTPLTSTGGVRPDAFGGRRRQYTSLPSSGTSSQSPPV